MGTYHWVTERNADSVPGGLVSDPPWYTPDIHGNTFLSVPAYAGAGDVLVRTEFAGWIGVQTGSDYGDAEGFMWQMNSLILGEVTTSGAGTDPNGRGAREFAFSTEMAWTGRTLSWGDPTVSWVYFINASTGGYVTSKARRGPEKYGAGTPAMNFTIFTDNAINWVPGSGDLASSWGFTARCLWFTP